MSYLDFKHLKDLGREGRNNGIPLPLPELSKFVPNIQKSRFYIIAGSSGAGKSKLTNEMFVFNAYDEFLKNPGLKFRIIYWSLELPREYIIGALIVRWLQKHHDILVDIDHVLSLGDKSIHPYINELIESEACVEYVDGFHKLIDIRTDKLNYIGASNQINQVRDEQGTVVYEDVVYSGEKRKKFKEYIEHDPELTTMFIIDHIGLISPVAGQNKKKAMDDLTEIFIHARNNYNFTIIANQQLNRSFNSTDRFKLDQVLPKDSDFKDTNATVEGCDVAIGILNPYREGMDTFGNYRIKPKVSDPEQLALKGRALILHIVKNRYGTAFKTFPILFFGETGTVEHLPNPMKIEHYKKVKESFKHWTDG